MEVGLVTISERTGSMTSVKDVRLVIILCLVVAKTGASEKPPASHQPIQLGM